MRVATLLQTVGLCEAFNTFPNDGGLYDQDPWLMDQFSMVFDARAIRADLDSKKPGGRK